MAERTNKPKPEEEEKPVDCGSVTGSGQQAAAVQTAKYKDDVSVTPAACPGFLRFNAVTTQAGAQQDLAGVTVRIEGAGIANSRVTDDSGQLDWTLPTGSYTITVTAPAGYKVSTVPASPVTISSNQTVSAQAVFTCAETEIQIRMFHDVDGSCDAKDQPGVSGRIQFFTRSGEFIACKTTNADGVATHTFKGLDAIEIRLDDTYTQGCNVLQHRMTGGLHTQLVPGSCLRYSIPLYTIRSEVLVAASVSDCGKMKPLEGTRFLLYRGTDVSRAPIAADVYTGAAIRWGDLEADVYTVTALPPPTEKGRRLRPVTPRDGVKHIQLIAGTNDLRNDFVFEPRQDMIMVRVVKDQFNTPLPGVSIDFLNQSDNTIDTVTTNSEGFASYPAQRSLYTVRPSTFKFPAEGTHWFIDSGASFQVDLRNIGAAPSPITMLAQKDIHGVRCILQDRNGNARPFAAVEILDERGRKLKDAHTDATGLLDERLPAAGHYTLVVLPQIQRVSFETHSVEDLGIIRSNGSDVAGLGGGATAGFGRVAESFTELTSYPQLTDGGGGGGGGGRQRRPAGTSSASTSQYGYTIEGALREVLGWRPKNTDMRGFTEALTRSFDVKQVEGHTEYAWTPRAAALVVESELGAITGAQKSIYERGKSAFDQAAPKLDALYPLRQDADVENCDAVRFIVRTAFEDLVREFGQSGGPRVQLVNDKFNRLLGTSNLAVTEQLDPVCQLAVMRDRFGLRRGAVNTIAEEENLTNFLIVVDHLKSLRITWNNNIQFFDRTGNDPFLGTQLVLLSRALGNVAEGVDELRYVLSSVLLDEAEQQTILIEYPGQTPLYLAELLTWIEHVATVEGPQLLTESGKDGAGALRSTLELLRTLVSGAQNPPNTVPSAYRTARVQRALQELALALQDASKLATIQGVN